MSVATKSKSLLERLSHWITAEPEDRHALLKMLRAARDRNVIEADALAMIEGILQMADLCARDIMVPRAQINAINISDPLPAIIHFLLDKEHSRYPVFEGNRDNIIGILLAKDLLHCYHQTDGDVRGMLRPAVFIPESKRLNALLQAFKVNHNHLALVVDEYGGIAGLITIEDVLEQIVGDIEDEYDFDEEQDNIIALGQGRYRIRGLTEMEQFNQYFGTHYSSADTIGGFVVQQFGYVPRSGEQRTIDQLQFEVQRSDGRQIQLLLLQNKSEIPDAG